jgi:ELWxxDGT repeat protein
MFESVGWYRCGRSMRAVILGLLIVAGAVQPGRASGPASVVFDHVDGVDPRAASRPSGFTDLGDVILFSATDGVHGRELWRTNGTAAGTALVADLHPGEPDGLGSFPHAVADRVLYFGARRGVWRSDGTAAGTRRLADITARSVVVAGGRLLAFVQSNDDLALWEVDRDTGAAQQRAVFPNSDIAPSPTVIGETLYFAAGAPQAIWRLAPGETAPTQLVQVQLRFPDSGNTDTQLIAVGAQLFFIAEDPATGAELWRSDGTPGGTRLVRDIAPGASWGIHFNDYTEGYEPYFTAFGDVLLFFANDGVSGLQLWRSDGTADGTTRLSDFRQHSGGADGTEPGDDDSDLARSTIRTALLDGRLYFTVRPSGEGLELWSTDGSLAGTVLVKALSSDWAAISGMVTMADALLINIWHEPGPELIRSDGTAAGTARFAAVDTYELTVTERGLLFAGLDGAGWEPWITDGSSGGTRRVADISRGAVGLAPRELTAFGDRLAFTADDGVHGRELWRSDGTAAGTRLVADLWPGSLGAEPSDLTASGRSLYFLADDATLGRALWRTDLNTVSLVLAPDTATQRGTPHTLTADGRGGVFFRASDAESGSELWHSDGTPAGTRQLADIFPGSEGSFVLQDQRSTALLGRTLLFAADDGVHGPELWRSDGTSAGTALVEDTVPGAQGYWSRTLDFLASNDRVAFFLTSTPPPGEEIGLWRTDGSAAGTIRLATLPAAPDAAVLRDGRLHFIVPGYPPRRWTLWQSDGTPPGTGPVASEKVFTGRDLTAADGVLFYIDGATLRRVGCGSLGSLTDPYATLRTVDDRLLLIEQDNADWQLSSTDGNADGVRELQRFHGGDRPQVVRVGRTVFLAAEDGAIGPELWSMPVSALPAVDARRCAPTPTPTRPTTVPTPFPCDDDTVGCTRLDVLPSGGVAGEEIDIAVRLRALGEPIAGVQLDLDFPDGVVPLVSANGVPDCTVDPAINKNGTVFAFLAYDCPDEPVCNRMRALVLALDNVDPIADGAILFTCRVALGEQLEAGDYVVDIYGAGVSDPSGNAPPVDAVDGVITVEGSSGTNPNLPAGSSGGCQLDAAPARAAWPLLLALLLGLPRAWRWRARR